MPYIPKQDRKRLDPSIDLLADILIGAKANDAISRELTYIFYRLAKILCDPEKGGVKTFARMNMIRGCFKSADGEFKRRIIDDYEDLKIAENGDVE